ncbi:hypothetical protein GO986_18715 [Deinococcus sp. HMF7620]|uniref:Uncharacterized protein n=2 Tax=Deinococcus arboris TaxID=2682977 RepID=A0A7C9I1N7_9DEIO|nr:hypothetical protein [Deinococcus arboris]
MTYRGEGLAQLRNTGRGLTGEATLFFTSPFLVFKAFLRYVGPFTLDGERQDGVIRLSISRGQPRRRRYTIDGVDLDMEVQGPDQRFTSLAEAEA